MQGGGEMKGRGYKEGASKIGVVITGVFELFLSCLWEIRLFSLGWVAITIGPFWCQCYHWYRLYIDCITVLGEIMGGSII